MRRQDSFYLGMVYMVVLGSLLVAFIEVWYLMIIPAIAGVYLLIRRSGAERGDSFLLLFAVVGMFLVFFVALPVAFRASRKTPALGNKPAPK